MNTKGTYKPGANAVAQNGWLAANKWLIARRLAQFGFIGLFLIGPISLWVLNLQDQPTKGIWIVKGTLASSITLDFLPLTDPFIALQTFVAGHILESTALTGVAIVVAAYALLGGRTYCSWVCPINVVTDTAHWLRQKLGLEGGAKHSRKSRYWIMTAALAASAVTGSVAWELINPITILSRGILFGAGFAWFIVLAVFLYDLFAARRGWCSHLCPVGAFYSLIGHVALLRVSAVKRADCNNCMDCFAVCPEAHVISPVLRGAETGTGPLILSPNCTNCGRCIDVCAPDVFKFTTRFNNTTTERSETSCNTPQAPREAA
ncbi:MAG: quinol dehydrogenase ferredoxin subunit NapH [Rhodospirillales bacterium]|nr:quinol dehydrogenase ferredoxin subunit NapH [Rhodospirillales bacterium]